MYKIWQRAIALGCSLLASACFAEIPSSVRDILKENPSSIELGLIRLELLLTREQDTIRRDLPGGFDTFMKRPTFDGRNGSVVISMQAKASNTIAVSKADCTNGVRAIRNMLTDQDKLHRLKGARTFVGHSIIPAYTENRTLYGEYREAALAIEELTEIRFEVIQGNKQLFCAGALLSEDVSNFE